MRIYEQPGCHVLFFTYEDRHFNLYFVTLFKAEYCNLPSSRLSEVRRIALHSSTAAKQKEQRCV